MQRSLTSLARLILLLFLTLSACNSPNVSPTNTKTQEATLPVITIPPTSTEFPNTPIPTYTPTMEPLPEPPEDQIVWQLAMPAKSPRAYCNDFIDLYEQKLREIYGDDAELWYSYDLAYDYLPPGIEQFNRSGDDTLCIHIGADFPSGAYHLRFQARVYKEITQYVNKATRVQLFDLTKYVSLIVYPPARGNHGLIAFVDVYTREDGMGLMHGLEVMDSDGSGVTEIIQKIGVSEGFAWSPDGKRLALIAENELSMVNADGTGITQLVMKDNLVYYPQWSPDGQTIAFVGQVINPGQLKRYGELYLIHVEDSTVVQLTGAGEMVAQPVWSPDGKTIAYVAVNENSSSGKPTGEIQLIQVDNSAVKTLPGTGAFSNSPKWSPNGKQIAYVNNGEICIVNVDSQKIVQLTETPDNYDFYPQWSPDGKQIFFASSGGENPNFYHTINAIDILHLEETELQTLPINYLSPISWLSADKPLLFSSGGMQNRIYKMNPDGSGFQLLLGFGESPAWQP